MWKKFKEEFDLGDLRIHDLRRSYATYAKSAGIGLAHISDLLGHSNSRTTERHYAFLKDDVRAEQSETISRLMQQSLDRQ
jgi:integrase